MVAICPFHQLFLDSPGQLVQEASLVHVVYLQHTPILLQTGIGVLQFSWISGQNVNYTILLQKYIVLVCAFFIDRIIFCRPIPDPNRIV